MIARLHDLSWQISHVRGGVEMTTEIDISADLMQLAVFAEREDWLYQAELRLADEFSRVALAFVLTQQNLLNLRR